MAEDQGIFTDAGAYGGSVPQAPRPADPTVVTAAVGNLAGASQKAAVMMYQADQSDRLLKAKIHLAKRFSELETGFGQETDLAAAETKFQKESEAIREEAHAYAKDEKTKTQIEAAYQQVMLPISSNVKKEVLKRKVGSYQIGSNQLRKHYLATGVLDPDPNMTSSKTAWADHLQDSVKAGFYNELDAQKALIGFNEELDFQRARLLTKASPSTAYNLLVNPENFPNLSSDARGNLLVASLSGMGNAEKAGDRQTKLNQVKAAKDLYTDHAKGALTKEAVFANKDALSLTDYKSLLSIVGGAGGATKDNPVAYNNALEMIWNGNDRAATQAEILRMNREGFLSGATTSTLLTKNEQTAESGGVKGPHARGLKYLKGKLGTSLPGDIAHDNRNAEAIREYDDWYDQNPNATDDEVFKEAENIVLRWGLIDYSELSISMPKPYAFAGRNPTVKDLNKSMLKLNDDRVKGLVSTATFQREAKSLKDWLNITRAKVQTESENPSGTTKRR